MNLTYRRVGSVHSIEGLRLLSPLMFTICSIAIGWLVYTDIAFTVAAFPFGGVILPGLMLIRVAALSVV